MTGFNRGHALAVQFTKKAPAESANYAGKEIAYTAFKNTPFVTPQKIDAELDIITLAKLGKKGQKLNTKYAKNRNYVSATADESGAASIVRLRAWAGSKYNQLTNQRYFISGSPFAGLKGAARMAVIDVYVQTMINARHKSGHFLAAGWLPSIRILKAVVNPQLGGAAKIPSNYNDALGTAEAARAGQPVVQCVIENDVGLDGKNAASHNHALLTIGLPALQRAVDTVGKKELEYALKKLGYENFQVPINAAWGP